MEIHHFSWQLIQAVLASWKLCVADRVTSCDGMAYRAEGNLGQFMVKFKLFCPESDVIVDNFSHCNSELPIMGNHLLGWQLTQFFSNYFMFCCRVVAHSAKLTPMGTVESKFQGQYSWFQQNWFSDQLTSVWHALDNLSRFNPRCWSFILMAIYTGIAWFLSTNRACMAQHIQLTLAWTT